MKERWNSGILQYARTKLYMRISLSQLKKLSVETKSGFVLGKIKDIIFETEGQSILQYEVGGLVGRKYLISREQIVSIDDKKMIVEDNVAKIENKIGIERGKVDVSPVTMRN